MRTTLDANLMMAMAAGMRTMSKAAIFFPAAAGFLILQHMRCKLACRLCMIHVHTDALQMWVGGTGAGRAGKVRRDRACRSAMADVQSSPARLSLALSVSWASAFWLSVLAR